MMNPQAAPRPGRRGSLTVGLVLLASIVLFQVAVALMDRHPYRQISGEMQVALPRFVQVLMAGGDRYLAANMGAIRAQVAENLKLDRAGLAVLGRVQSDVAWLNPAHEDNYYTAAAILPWSDQLPAAETILREAAMARPRDPWPGFYFGFFQFYFHKDPVSGADWLRFAAMRTSDETERLQLEDMAARWYSRGPSTENAIGVLDAMAKNARHSGFRNYLERRIQRLRNLQMLQAGVDRYIGLKGHLPLRLDDLVSSGIIKAIPKDPFGIGYILDADGKPTIPQPKVVLK